MSASSRSGFQAAVAALEEAVGLGWRRSWWIAHDPALASVRELPRVAALQVGPASDPASQIGPMINARAVDNARKASIACARRAVERHEVELLLAQRA